MLWIGQAKHFDASATGSLTCKGYRGIASDGEYLYYAPYYDGSAYHGRVLRQKIYAIFTEASTWSVYDARTTDSLTCKGYSGAVFDGRFMYFAPYNNGNPHGIVLRYDTTKPFADAGSWDSYNAGATDSLTCKGFSGAVYDGEKFIYFIPLNNGSYDGIVLRYDTQKPFKSADAWDSYNAGSLATGFWGGVIVENFLYMSPYTAGSGTGHGKIVRYDMSKPFADAGSWETYDVTAVNSDLKGFATPCTDGRFIYFPNSINNTVLRYDTAKPFDSSSSYSYFNVTNLSLPMGHSGCCVQGDFIVFCPIGMEYLVYDTTKPFADAGSWAFKVCLSSGMNICGFCGCYGDPNYIYFSPLEYASNYHGVVGRIRVAPCPAQSLPTPGSTEDLSGYTAYEQEYVTKLSGSATASPDDVSCFASCFKDYEQDFFNGFEVRFGLRLSSITDIAQESDPDTTRLVAFSLSRIFTDMAFEEVGSNDPSVAIIITWDEDGNVVSRKIHLIKGLDAARTTGYSISTGTTYYCKVVRTAGSATITLYIYSDSNYTTLVSTQALTSFSTTGKWRFIYALRGMYDPEALAEATWRVEGLKIVSY